uniref:MAGUK p55 scaffold protein 4 n=1 Tax=Chrysemys picta bellii TaxID=8478 RepID=A0A8C3HC62_CHRPI
PYMKAGLSHVLTLVLQELSLFCKSDVNGVGVLYDLLRSPWLQALLKVKPSLSARPVFLGEQYLQLASPSLCHVEILQIKVENPSVPEIRELRRLLRNPNLKALLSAHDTVAQKDFEPILPPLPDNIPENEEAMRIVCLVKNKQPLGATIKRHEITGDIVVARVIHGGLADRSGLLYAGDKLVEVNGVSVEGLEPEQVIHILSLSQGTIMFKLIPVSERPVSNQTTLYVRAMADYWPLQDPAIPCADAGLPFKKGEILQIVDQNDVLWWQARQVSDLSACAGLIPSNHLLKRKQREFWWSQPFQPHVCLKSTICECKILQLPVRTGRENYFLPFPAGFRRSMRLCRRKSQNSQQPCYARCPSSCYSAAAAAPYEEVVRYQRHPTDRNRLIVLVGPSGVGVNELRRRLIGMNPHHFQSAVPHTTRAQKSYEENGREYHYVSKETFENMVYTIAKFKGFLPEASRKEFWAIMDEGTTAARATLQGIQMARTHELKPYIIFIKPPSMSCMRQSRKNARIITDYYVNMKFKEEDLQEMEDCAKKMEAQFGQFFDQVIVNDSLQEACVQLLSAVHQAQDEPQWVPATWICSDTQP